MNIITTGISHTYNERVLQICNYIRKVQVSQLTISLLILTRRTLCADDRRTSVTVLSSPASNIRICLTILTRRRQKAILVKTQKKSRKESSEMPYFNLRKRITSA